MTEIASKHSRAQRYKKIQETQTGHVAPQMLGNSHLCLLPLLVGSTEAFRASSLTGRDLTRRTKGTATRGCLTGTTRGTGDTLPRYSNNLETRERGRSGGETENENVRTGREWSHEKAGNMRQRERERKVGRQRVNSQHVSGETENYVIMTLRVLKTLLTYRQARRMSRSNFLDVFLDFWGNELLDLWSTRVAVGGQFWLHMWCHLNKVAQ